jgi:hypothetical protein
MDKNRASELMELSVLRTKIEHAELMEVSILRTDMRQFASDCP